MSIKAVIFDIDGTLVDNVNICIEAYRQTLEHYARRPFATEEITRYFGLSEDGILKKYIPECLPEAVDTYFTYYAELHQSCREPFSGIRPLLEWLQARAVPMAVVTGKGARGAEITLRAMELYAFMQSVQTGTDQGLSKPAGLRRVLEQFNLPPQDVIYVGDTAYDLESANAVGVPAIGAAWSESTTIYERDYPKALRVFHQVQDFSDWVTSEINLS